MLSISGLHTYYGAVHALKGVDVEVKGGEIVALIGANGAGKSTLLMSICGNPKPRHGYVKLAGEDITGIPTHHLVRRGLAHAPEGRRIFPRMTVLENLRMGAVAADPAHFDSDLERVYGLFPRLKERSEQRGGTLSGGEQQMLAVARILRTGADILLLDEISEGLAPVIVQALARMIRELKKQGFTIIMVEQNFRFAAPLADHFIVIEHGEVVLSFPAADLPAHQAQMDELLSV